MSTATAVSWTARCRANASAMGVGDHRPANRAMPGLRFNARADAPTPHRTAYPISVRSATGPGTPMRIGSVQPASLVRVSQARAGAGENTVSGHQHQGVDSCLHQRGQPVAELVPAPHRARRPRQIGP